MPSHSAYRMDNTVKASLWGVHRTSGPSKGDVAAAAALKATSFNPPDRKCTLCGNGLFVPRFITDSTLAMGGEGGNKADDERHIRHAKEKLKRFEAEFKHANEEKAADEVLPALPLLEMSEVKLGKKLGKGGSATVYEVTGFELKDLKTVDVDQQELRQLLWGSFPHKNRYVLKKLSSKYQAALPKNEPYSRACAINLVLEAQILRMLDHPNILKLHAIGMQQDTAPFLILTYLAESMEERICFWRTSVRKHKLKLETSAGNMWRLVSIGGSNKKALTSHLMLRRLLWERMHVARDIALAVEHLHSKDIIYRDVKISNVGFNSSGVVKIFDFGISRMLPRTVKQPTNADPETFCMSEAGTKMYMAPEIMESKPYGFPADVYSFGVILWQLLSLTTPYPIPNATKHPLFDFQKCACWPIPTQELVAALMNANPNSRPNITHAHQELTAQKDRLKLAFTQSDQAPVLAQKRVRSLGRSGTFELSIDLEMP